MEQFAIFLATGALAGLMAGLFGVGGGLVMVPALALLLPPLGVPSNIAMQSAIATSLAVIAVTSLSSTLAHHRRGAVRWRLWLRLAAGLAVGAIVGAYIADHLSGATLQRIVGVGAVLVAVQMLRARQRPVSTNAPAAPATAELLSVGSVIGLLSSLIGIGGGSLVVPYLSLRGLAMREAVGTAAACGVPIAWAGSLGFVIAGWNEPGLPAWSAGYVNLSAFAGLALASVATAPVGARLAHRLPPLVLKRAFAIFLLLIGLILLWR